MQVLRLNSHLGSHLANESDLWVEKADVLDFKTKSAIRIGGKIQFLFDCCTPSRHLAGCREPDFRVLCVERGLSTSVAPLPCFRVSGKLRFDCCFVLRTDRLSLRCKSGGQCEGNCRTPTVHDSSPLPSWDLVPLPHIMRPV